MTLPLALLERQDARPLRLCRAEMADQAWRAWRLRPLDRRYALLSFGCLPARLYGADGAIAIQSLLAIRADGTKEILGLWKDDGRDTLWPEILGDLKRRGLEQATLVSPAASHGLLRALAAGFPAAILAPSPLRVLKAPLELVPPPERTLLAAALEEICEQGKGARALRALDRLAARWRGAYPALANEARDWSSSFAPFFALPVALRRLVSGITPAASLSAKWRRRNLCPPSRFAGADAALKSLSETIGGATQDWRVSPHVWQQAQAALAALSQEAAATTFS